MDRQTVLHRLQLALSSGLESSMDTVLRSNATEPAIREPSLRTQAVEKLIATASYRAAMASTCGGIVPGWAGMLTLAPSLASVTRVQLGLVRDVAHCAGVSLQNPRPLLLGVMARSLDKPSAHSLAPREQVLQWEAASLQSFGLQLAGSIAQQAAGAAVSRWLPAVGPAALGVWSGYTTKRIGRSAHQFFNALSDGSTTAPVSPGTAAPGEALPLPGSELERCKLQALIGLARVDGRVCDNERAFISQALTDPRLSDAQRLQLRLMLEGSHAPLEGLDVLARHPDAAIGLLSNLAVLAWQDGQLHPSEKLYVRHLGKLLGFERDDVDELLTHAGEQIAQPTTA